MDIDTIDLGADFVEVITEAVASCDPRPLWRAGRGRSFGTSAGATT
jgi:hypothetical protein